MNADVHTFPPQISSRYAHQERQFEVAGAMERPQRLSLGDSLGPIVPWTPLYNVNE